MEQQLTFEERCESYLLGELSEAEREQFEEAYFSDDALFERFLAVKDELLDAYARGEVAEEKLKRFTEYFLATAPRRRRLDETQNFIHAVSAVSTKANDTNAPLADTTHKSGRQLLADFFKLRPLAWQIALASLLIILGGTWILVRNRQPKPALDERATLQPSPIGNSPTDKNYNIAPNLDNQNTNQSSGNANDASKPASKNPANNNQSAANANNRSSANQNVVPKPAPKITPEPAPQIASAQIASIILLPFASRDIGESNTLRINSDTRSARLRLVFKTANYRNYSATVTTIEGATVRQQNNLKAVVIGTNKSVTLQIPPTLLRGQDYIVTLTGQTADGQTETAGKYYFRVEHGSSQNTQTPKTQP